MTLSASSVSASSLLCLALLHFLWQGAAITAIALLLGAIARRFSAQAQYWVLCIGLAAMPVAFAATLGWLMQWSAAGVPVTVALAADSSAALTPLTDEPRMLFLLPDATAAAIEQSPLTLAATWQRLSPLCAALYLLAVLAMSLRLVVGLCGARRLVRESAAIHDERMLDFVADQCRELGLHTAPVVAYCRDVAVPTVIGVLRPTILLPLAATTGMTTEEIETILTHELVHIRRRDHLFVLLQRLLEVVFFFHPGVWLLSRRISDVREHCCDDHVISLGVEPQVYVESLLRAAELSLFGPAVKPTSSLAIALSAIDQPSRLRERILRLVNQPTPAPFKLRPMALAVAVGLMLIAIATPLAVQSFAQTPDTETPSTSKDQPPADEASKIDSSSSTGETKVFKLPRYVNVLEGEIDSSASTEETLEFKSPQYVQVLEGVELMRNVDDALYIVWDDAQEPSARKFRGQLGSQFEIEVTGKTDGYVWGSDVYTDDSDLGTAAVHAGALKAGERGTVTLTVVKSPPRHVGSTRNGVTSRDYGTFGGSFMLHRLPEAAYKPQTTAGDLARALGVLDRLTEEKWSSEAIAQAQADVAVARNKTARVQQMLAEVTEDRLRSPHPDLNHIHRSKTTDCRSCHQVPAETVTNATSFRGKLGRQFDVEIVGSSDGSLWGTDIYTDDSHIPTAAVHAGIVKPGEHAIVTVTIVESPEEHVASERNGVKSGTWGIYPSSYILMRKSIRFTQTRPASPSTARGFSGKLGRRFDVEIVGQTDGGVWGTDVYTDDSHIATAAVHAGLVKPNERAIVTLTIVESPDQHRGTTRSGVTTRDYGSFASSFILQRSSEESTPQPRSIRHRPYPSGSLGGAMRGMSGMSGMGSMGGTAGGGTGRMQPQSIKAHDSAEEMRGEGHAMPAAPEGTGTSDAPPSSADTAWYRFTRKRPAAQAGASAVVLRGEFGTQLDVELTGRTTGRVWGSDVYTDDSDIPTAAVHAGLLKPGEKGTITITIVKSPEQYVGSSRNGVTTDAWGSIHPSGYILQRKQEAPVNATPRLRPFPGYIEPLSPTPPTPDSAPAAGERPIRHTY